MRVVLALVIVGGFESISVSPKKRKFLGGMGGGAVLLRAEFLLRFIVEDSLCPLTETSSCMEMTIVINKMC